MEIAAKEEDIVLKERKEKLIQFLKKKYNWISYIILGALVWMAVWIRTRNLPRLKDVTTGGWTLGPDLDPFLFLRWAKYIVANGSLMAIDTMRYVPLGYETKGELILLPYMIAWFHKIASGFGSVSVEQSAVLFPAVMFGLTVIAFFLLVRKIFIDSAGEAKANIIALIASFFLIVIPSLLSRTIAGIPEKESAGFFFMFLAFYFFLVSWKSSSPAKNYSFAFLAGLATASMALVWGGYSYIVATLSLTMLIAFFFGHVTKEKFYIYAVWLFSSFLIMNPFSTRYTFRNLFTSTITGFAIAVFAIAGIAMLISSTRLQRFIEYPRFAKIPRPVTVFLITATLGAVFILLFLGPNFIFSNIQGIISNLVTPISTRFGITVAENRQPFFPEWSSSFGPSIQGIPLFFWLFFIGSIYLFHHMLKEFDKKDRWILTGSYALFLLCIVFSRYKSDSILNGTNAISLGVYVLGFAALLASFSFYYWRYHSAQDERFRKIDISLILLLTLFFFSIISARGAVRVIMVLVPPASIMVSWFVVLVSAKAFESRESTIKLFAWIAAAIVVFAAVFSGYQFAKVSRDSAVGYAPSEYTHQWQKAMSWVRENTPKNAVFSHWWDYGYWVQSIGERATVLDGGNAIVYWDHLMGRYALTGRDDMQALEFLCAHDTTHLLIDSTDIGKYSAFSSIGSDVSYDRVSFIPTLLRGDTSETKNGTISAYNGGFGIDEDIIYTLNGTNIFLPRGQAAVLALLLRMNKSGDLTESPIAVYQDNKGNRYDIPIRYAFQNNRFRDFGSGIEAGVFLMPRLFSSGESIQLDKDGALFYLSNRTVKSQLARLYLYKEDNPYFKLVHSEDDFVVDFIKKNQNITEYDFVQDEVYAGGRGSNLAGPIRIWEVSCPSDIPHKPEYLKKEYPDVKLTKV